MIDTSALLRLFLADGPLPPALERAFAQGCNGEALLLVPDLCLLECASVLRKQVLRAAMTSEESKALLADLVLLPLRTVPAMELVIDAYELALIHALSVYDATYLALALRHGAGLITADRDLDAAARACGCTPDWRPAIRRP